MSKLQFHLNKPLEEAAAQIVGAQTADDIAEVLEVPKGQLLHILYSYPDEKKYISFDIKKKNGGYRNIKAAKGGLRVLQSKLAPLLASHYRLKNPVHGFVKERNIVSNATQHKRKRYVFNVDLSDFYGTINFGRVRGLFRAKPFEMGEKAASVVAQICIFKNSLPQGAATSPIISNFIASELDRKLSRLARRYKLTYTRYADDITFSSNNRNFPEGIAFYDGNNPITNDCFVGQVLEETVSGCGFSINHEKTRLQIRGVRQDVTGLTVNEFPNVRRSYIRNIRALLHAWRKFGPDGVEVIYRRKYAKNKSRLVDTERHYFKEALYGMLAFLRMVRGEDELYLKLCLQTAELDKAPPELIKRMKEQYKMYDVFISHASEDKIDIVRPIYDACKSLGISAFLDEEEIDWGDSLTEVLNHALGKSKLFLAVLSNNSVGKKWPRKEINAALARQMDGKQKFLPLVVGSPDMDIFGLTNDLLYVNWKNNPDEIAEKLKFILSKYA
ncbi:TIR domain-containing anti-phage reverse transcriptase [Nitrosococcus wardiae]|uniref:TIR domain-containing anti-phage reverse transcriptase n=1 Tax=Nitrosococcus wardiae TaxID=1814290 RepID=UPI00141AB153|nr:TIR domain-containing anti-phage reverse transcriptase [Nitrosococcus wardiae]